VINKKTLKSILTFTENQHPAPSFILIYILTWFAWHNQLFMSFVNAQGDFFTKVTAALNAIEDNQYIVVFLLTCLIFLVRLTVNYLSFRSRELLNNVDDEFVNARDDQKFAANADVANIMSTLAKTQQKLADSKEREKKLSTEKKAAITKLLAVQHELEEARADIDILSKNSSNTRVS
jgi:septal ring factor EnvC (AmiA/AmiB activator)